MRYTEFLTEDELFEINMSPNNLTKLVKEIPGAKVGLEFEMIVPDIEVDDDSGGSNGENDYSMDERCDDIDDIVDFFQRGNGSDYNNERRLREKLQEEYYEWISEASSEAWGDVSSSEVRDWIENNTSIKEDAMQEYRDENPDADDDEVDAAGESAVESAYDEAMDEQFGNSYYDSAHEQWREDYESDLSERDWLRSQSYHNMSDIENSYDETYWPYQHSSNENEDLATIAAEIEQATGRDVQSATGYHDISRGDQASEGFYILETDGSLRPNDGDSGLELVSPPLELSDMMTEIGLIVKWAKGRGCYTGKQYRTGLHMNVSVPNYSKGKLDFVKLALLLGDNHVLKEFDRYVVQGTNYAQSSFDLLEKSLKNNPGKAKDMMEKMRTHFDLAASKAIHSGNTDKYTSINVKDNRVEFRGPGNDYLSMFESNPNKLLAPMMRMVVALEAACDPEKYRQEYQKKLYKMLSNSVPNKDILEVFTAYASGKGFDQSALRGLLKDRNLTRKSNKIAQDPNSRGNYGVWRKSTGTRMKINGEYVEFNDMTMADAAGEMDMLLRDHGVNVAEYEVRLVPSTATLGGRPSNPDGNWILFRQHRREGDHVTPFDVEVLYRFNAVNHRDAEHVRDQYVNEHKPSFQVLMGSDPEKKNGQPGNTAATQTQSKYEIYNKENGRAVTYEDGRPIHLDATDPEDAASKMERILADFNIGNPSDYDVRSVLNVPAHTTTTDARPSNSTGNWGIWLNSADRFARWPSTENLRRFPTEQAANEYLNNLRQSTVGMRTDIEVREIPEPAQTVPTATGAPQATAAQPPNWEIRNASTNGLVDQFYAPDQNTAIGIQFDYLQDQGLHTDDYTLQAIERAPRATSNDAAWEREQQSYRTGQNWQVYNADDQNIVVRTLNNMEAQQVAATLPRLEDELNLPRGSLRVRTV